MIEFLWLKCYNVLDILEDDIMCSQSFDVTNLILKLSISIIEKVGRIILFIRLKECQFWEK